MNEGFTPLPLIERAFEILKQLEAGDREYQEYCDELNRKGYEPQWCRHGPGLWAWDYDAFCYECEYPRSNRERALEQARRERDGISWSI